MPVASEAQRWSRWSSRQVRFGAARGARRHPVHDNARGASCSSVIRRALSTLGEP